MQIPALRRKRPPNKEGWAFSSRDPNKPAAALCSKLREYLDEAAVKDVYDAYLFGAEAHEGQRRRSGEAYIHHPLAVADILGDLRLDSRSIIAAILHDVIEDTPTAKEQIAELFGGDVAHLVDGVSKISQLEFESREHAEAENFRKMLMAMSQDIRVILIKLADRLHNMRTLEALTPTKRKAIARQTLDIFAPIANRLGLYEWCRELEGLSFKHLYPKRHTAITKALTKQQGNRRSVVKKLRDSIEGELKQAGIPAEVLGRKKTVYSIYKKMLRKRKTFDELHDIYGFRVIVKTVDDSYRALGVIHNLYKPIPGRFTDYIAIPKTNGYQSLHTVVFGAFGESLEVQIRTEEMNRIAESGVAAHWIYKSDSSAGIKPRQLARQWLLDLLDTQRETGNPGEFIEHLKIDLFPDEVYVFTPRGDIKKLPRGATALDFAYAVHSDVGARCSGARVNHELVSLPTVLNNGDHVEIITSDTVLPTASWLSYTVTSKARASIRQYLKHQRRDEAIKLGKRLFDRAIRTRRFGRKKLTDSQKRELLDTLDVSDWDDLLADVGLGKRLPNMVAKQLLPPLSRSDRQGQQDGSPLAISGTEGMLISYAKCCHPIPGDSLIGIFTTGRGVVVHTADCRNTAGYRKHPDKWVHVDWDKDVTGEFAVVLRVDVANKRGVLAKIASIIAEQGSNINSVAVEDRDGKFSSIRFTIEVKDRDHLAHIMRNIRRASMVTRVTRIKG
ncbi:MAG: bifunctional (p)ppGpp synthetase/guanosine-3',5'-bis(diphosphate) 3'-pyrophosphohydrolase [Gammaproteobacteria bacterium]|nr:bifunctional (p)ppGpp synthetase/guanosine-3',5'-bis(diphosphate) 3'-pyrophosphohydrolase [Gammaproteobacteria bacterium]